MAEDFSFCQLGARNNEIKLETLSFRFPVSCFPVICFSCALLMPVPLALSSHSWVLLVLRWWWWTASLSTLLLAMLHQCHSPPGCRSLLFHRCSCWFQMHTHTDLIMEMLGRHCQGASCGQEWCPVLADGVLAGTVLTAFCCRWKACPGFEGKCSKRWGFFHFHGPTRVNVLICFRTKLAGCPP